MGKEAEMKSMNVAIGLCYVKTRQFSLNMIINIDSENYIKFKVYVKNCF